MERQEAGGLNPTVTINNWTKDSWQAGRAGEQKLIHHGGTRNNTD